MKAIAFSDVLGFGIYTMEDLPGAADLLDYLHVHLDFLVREKNLHPPQSYPPHLQEVARNNLLHSVIDLLPMSDSLFISTEDVNLFVKQFSNLMVSVLEGSSVRVTHPQAVKDHVL